MHFIVNISNDLGERQQVEYICLKLKKEVFISRPVALMETTSSVMFLCKQRWGLNYKKRATRVMTVFTK